MKKLHTRQPVILDPKYYDVWLSGETPQGDLKEILSHEIDGALQFHSVGREVNATKGGKEGPGMIGPLNPL